MNRLLAANIFLLGLVSGLLVVNVNACAGGSAHAGGDCACTFDGPIDVNVVSTSADPLPVMICDGQGGSGLCSDVFEYDSGPNTGSFALRAAY